MREAMAAAAVGDDVYGEDPTVNRLQERGAALIGKRAALFVPSGTLGNQLCLRALAEPGREVIHDAPFNEQIHQNIFLFRCDEAFGFL